LLNEVGELNVDWRKHALVSSCGIFSACIEVENKEYNIGAGCIRPCELREQHDNMKRREFLAFLFSIEQELFELHC
jgi:hypothetical protein